MCSWDTTNNIQDLQDSCNRRLKNLYHEVSSFYTYMHPNQVLCSVEEVVGYKRSFFEVIRCPETVKELQGQEINEAINAVSCHHNLIILI